MYESDTATDQVGLGERIVGGAGDFADDDSWPLLLVGPLYPSILAFFDGLVGHQSEWVPYLNMAMDIMTALCVFRGASTLFDVTTAKLA